MSGLHQESRLPSGSRSYTQLQSRPWGPKFITPGRVLTFTILATVLGSVKLGLDFVRQNRKISQLETVSYRPEWAARMMERDMRSGKIRRVELEDLMEEEYYAHNFK
jgi:hypothetical protein